MIYDVHFHLRSGRFDSLLAEIIQKNELTMEVDMPLSSPMISGTAYLEIL